MLVVLLLKQGWDNKSISSLSPFFFSLFSLVWFSLQICFLSAFLPKLKASETFPQGSFWDSIMNGPFDRQDEESFDVSGQNAIVPFLGGDTVFMCSGRAGHTWLPSRAFLGTSGLSRELPSQAPHHLWVLPPEDMKHSQTDLFIALCSLIQSRFLNTEATLCTWFLNIEMAKNKAVK